MKEEEIIKKAMTILGSRTSERKKRSSAENAKKARLKRKALAKERGQA